MVDEIIDGAIVDYNEHGVLTIKAKFENVDKFIKRRYEKVKIQLIDSRPLSDTQRRMCYALIHAISDWSGTEDCDIKQLFKLRFLTENVEELGDEIFSLSNAPMSLVAEFQRYLVKFIVENDVPVKRPLIEYVDDIRDYTYQCLIHKKCVVCGRKSDLHHVDAVGMGNDREEIIHEGLKAISLCREHHTECHIMGNTDFFKKYHLDGGIEIDKTLCKIYKLKGDKK